MRDEKKSYPSALSGRPAPSCPTVQPAEPERQGEICLIKPINPRDPRTVTLLLDPSTLSWGLQKQPVSSEEDVGDNGGVKWGFRG